MPSPLLPLPFARHPGLVERPRPALLLIDFQQAFTAPDSPTFLPDALPALHHACRLLRSARTAGIPIAFSRHAYLKPPPPGGMGSWWTRFILDSDPRSNLAPQLTPRPGELAFRKTHYSALLQTPLQRWLREHHVRSLVLCGVMTHVCIDSTARDAFSRRYDVLIAADACASKSIELHQSSLLCLSHAIASVATTAQLVRRFALENKP